MLHYKNIYLLCKFIIQTAVIKVRFDICNLLRCLQKILLSRFCFLLFFSDILEYFFLDEYDMFRWFMIYLFLFS